MKQQDNKGNPKDGSKFVNRVSEMKDLQKALESADRGKGGMVMVRGEAGIGKSRLLKEVLSRAKGNGFNTMVGKCLYYRKAPYLPFTEMLKDFFQIDPLKPHHENSKFVSTKIEKNYPSLISHRKPLMKFFYKKNEPNGGFYLDHERISEAVSFFRRSGFRLFVIGKSESIPSDLKDNSATEIMLLGDKGDDRLNPRRLERIAVSVQTDLTTHSHSAVLFTSLDDLLSCNQKAKVDSLVRICSDIALSSSGIVAFATGNPEQEIIGTLKPLSIYLDEEKPTDIALSEENNQNTGPALSLFDIIFRLFKEISEENTLLVIIEDLHWGDKATFNLLQYLARKAKRENILIIGSYREEEADIKGDTTSLTLRESLQRFSREHLYSTIHLERFKTDTTQEMLRSILGEDPSKELLNRVIDETDGNPLFIVELMNVMGDEFNEPGSKSVSQPISASTLVGRRLDSLDYDSRAVLEQASVFGDRVDMDLISEAMEMDQEKILDIIDKLISLRFLREEEDGFVFEHQKVRESVYELIDEKVRRLLHGRCASILENRINQENTQDLTMLSHHHMMGGNCIKSLNYLLRIPGPDTAKISHEDFRRALSRGLKCLQKKEDARNINELRVQTLLRMGDLEEESGNLDRAQHFYKESISISEKKGIQNYLSSCYRRMGDLNLNLFEWENTVDFYLRSLHISKRSDHRAEISRTFRGLGRMYYLKGDYSRSLDCMMKYLEFPNPNKGKRYIRSIILMGDIYFEMGDFNQALTYYKLAIKTAQEKEQDPEIAISYLKMSKVLFILGDMGDSRRFCEWANSVSSTFGKGYVESEINLLLAEMNLYFNNPGTSYQFLQVLNGKVDRGSKDRYLLGEYMRISGLYYTKIREFEKSVDCYDEALAVFKDLEIPYRLGLGYLEYGLSLFQNLKVDDSIQMLKRAHQTFKSIKSLYYQNKTSSKLREVTFIKDSVIG